jgi:GR25 family glycosyltransferase involved in LPS biosynthesis
MDIVNHNSKTESILNDLPIYWINLDNHKERNDYMILQLNNKKHFRVSGVNGKIFDENKMNNYINKSKKNLFNDEKMTKGEIGCLLSHIKIYKESLKRNDDYIIVMEDDANMLNFMNNDSNNYLLNNYKNHECIQLCVILPEHVNLPKEKSPILLNWNEKNNEYYPWGFTWSTACYIISKNARIKLIEQFEKCQIIQPADFFIFGNLNTQTLFPPIISYSLSFDSSVQLDSLDYHKKSYYRINDYYFNKKLILITVWFGKLPEYFDLWLYTLKDMNYDVLFVTDQKINNIPNNVKYLNLTMKQFNNHLNKKTGYDVNIKSVAKLVDVKPLFGFLFNEFINNYEYWGWTDVDMLMGDITKILYDDPDCDIYSNGNMSFGPLMMFKKKLIDIYKYIEHYEDILNDSYICKVDESWWFIQNEKTKHLSIYKDEKTNVKYYSGKNICDFAQSKKINILKWENMCTGIDWGIRNDLKNKTGEVWKYYITDNKIFKNNIEINHSHLTLLKNNKSFNTFVKENILTLKKPFTFTINLTYHYNNEILDDLTTCEVYDKFVDISFCIE